MKYLKLFESFMDQNHRDLLSTIHSIMEPLEDEYEVIYRQLEDPILVELLFTLTNIDELKSDLMSVLQKLKSEDLEKHIGIQIYTESRYMVMGELAPVTNMMSSNLFIDILNGGTCDVIPMGIDKFLEEYINKKMKIEITI